MRKMMIAAAAAALALSGCAGIPPERIESDIARIERGVDFAAALVEAAATARVIDGRRLERFRSTVATARIALTLARDAAAAGDNKRAEALTREAEKSIDGAAAEMGLAQPAAPA